MLPKPFSLLVLSFKNRRAPRPIHPSPNKILTLNLPKILNPSLLNAYHNYLIA